MFVAGTADRRPRVQTWTWRRAAGIKAASDRSRYALLLRAESVDGQSSLMPLAGEIVANAWLPRYFTSGFLRSSIVPPVLWLRRGYTHRYVRTNGQTNGTLDRRELDIPFGPWSRSLNKVRTLRIPWRGRIVTNRSFLSTWSMRHPIVRVCPGV